MAAFVPSNEFKKKWRENKLIAYQVNFPFHWLCSLNEKGTEREQCAWPNRKSLHKYKQIVRRKNSWRALNRWPFFRSLALFFALNCFTPIANEMRWVELRKNKTLKKEKTTIFSQHLLLFGKFVIFYAWTEFIATLKFIQLQWKEIFSRILNTTTIFRTTSQSNMKSLKTWYFYSWNRAAFRLISFSVSLSNGRGRKTVENMIEWPLFVSNNIFFLVNSSHFSCSFSSWCWFNYRLI